MHERKYQLEAAELPFAVRWEMARSAWFAQFNNREQEEHCKKLADWHQARLDKHLEDHLSPESENSGVEA